MSSPNVPAARPGTSGPGRHRADTAPDDRGSLSIADTAVEKISAAVLDEIDEIGGAARRVLGLPMGSDHAEQRPRVTATVSGGSVSLDARVSVSYPAPVAATADRARRHLAVRVAASTGMQVTHVDITVTALTTPARPTHRRELA
ncbi:putative alkaline shock family protein YloU [Pseudonocardia sediminis]|uniref:Putative alkaline shock family protein YloU n=1 Tax=Pseudonocardia sediminis TaxID=1397368 RepID=A0A4Q7V347_PSEST|nr:Asp23/Gls24 family envelope stress response protein [Pseudonocardia sediminis]RZT89027.1 putative alkaline shock family protein YloU [Pseudonocardia sediminis]